MKVRFFGPPARPGYSGLLSIEQALRAQLETGGELDVDICLYPCTQAPPMDRPTVLICHDPAQWMHEPGFRSIYQAAAAVIGTAQGGQFIALPKGQRIGGMAELVRAIEGLAPPSPYRHLFVLYSTGCGGVERATLDMIAELSEETRKQCAILPVSGARLSLPIPEGVAVMQPGLRPDYIIRQMAGALRSVWVQPLVTSPGPILDACKEVGAKAYWLLCSSSTAVVSECRFAAAHGGCAVVTCESLKPLAADMASTVYIPHYVDAGPVRAGKRGKRLGYVGRLSHEKNVFGLPEVLAALPKEYTLDIYAPMLASPGRLRSEDAHETMAKDFAERGLADRVAWHWDILNRPTIYAGFDILLLPSKYEGYSMVAHEALSVGVTVVCADRTPLATEGNPGVFAFAMAGFMDDRPLTGPAVTAMAAAIKAAGKPTFAAVAKASAAHTLPIWRESHLATLHAIFA